jgi:hypothetical protein
VECFQVLSPITGRVIGAKEVRVVNDKVSITRLQVRVVSGLQLSIVPDNAVENGYIAETSVTRKLTAQYQVWEMWYPSFQGIHSLNHKKAFAVSVPAFYFLPDIILYTHLLIHGVPALLHLPHCHQTWYVIKIPSRCIIKILQPNFNGQNAYLHVS